MTVLVLERFGVEASTIERFEELARERVVGMRSAPGSLWADLYTTADDPAAFCVLSEWRSDADADAFTGANPLEVFDPVLAGETTTRRFNSGR